MLLTENIYDKKQLSILLPTHNDACDHLVECLQRQADKAGIDYEIIVADDGSTDENAIHSNNRINDIPHCSYVKRGINTGRAAIRNFLAGSSKYEWLLFIDCDMALPDEHFIDRYIQEMDGDADVIDGHTMVVEDDDRWKGNLRYINERAAAPRHAIEMRQNTPYHSFATANFMIRRQTMCAHSFDERIRLYGYEDVLFGKELSICGAKIKHIDNPVMFKDYETNASFVAKTEESMRTLHRFRDVLRGFSRILDTERKLRHIAPAIRLWHKLFGRAERRILIGRHPKIAIFNIYRLGYYMSLNNKDDNDN
ncbi:MAG: glycosyltransferase family 2 protein [Prevotella sp.]|nr:glycosyltransferase family 2 protein [Prevotella sp.]